MCKILFLGAGGYKKDQDKLSVFQWGDSMEYAQVCKAFLNHIRDQMDRLCGTTNSRVLDPVLD